MAGAAGNACVTCLLAGTCNVRVHVHVRVCLCTVDLLSVLAPWSRPPGSGCRQERARRWSEKVESGGVLAGPSLQARGRLSAPRVAAETSKRPTPACCQPGPQLSVCSTPARWGSLLARLCSGPRTGSDLQPSSEARELDPRVGQSTGLPFLGALIEEKAVPSRSVGLRRRRSPHWSKHWEPFPLGPHS